MIRLFRAGAATVPDQPAIITPTRTVTYSALAEWSEALAGALAIAARGIERFAIRVSDPAVVLALLGAGSLIGSEACVYPEGEPAELEEICGQLEHRTLVTDGELSLGAVEVLHIDDLVGTAELPPTPEHPPLMVMTTGTTGRRKGARHDWSRLVGSVRKPDPQPGTRWLLAYNLNQFGALQIVLHAIASKATLVAPRSIRATDALEAIREHGVTHASATPTFWRLLANLVDPAVARELPLRQITLGGEAVPDRLLAELGALFPDAQLSQIYGATEFGTSVSVRDFNGLPASVLQRTDDSPTQLKIVDGQLWVRSSIGMLGYHGEAAAPEDGWRATGDLVELRGDRIHFVGRAAETINVGGVKVHPLPVETAVGAIAEVELVRAFGRKNALTGQVVAVEVVARPGADLEALEAAIHQACAGLPAASRPRQIKFVDELAVRDQKIVRHPEPVADPPAG